MEYENDIDEGGRARQPNKRHLQKKKGGAVTTAVCMHVYALTSG